MNIDKLDNYIAEHRKNTVRSSDFREYLVFLMNKYGFEKDSDLYNKANISRQVWSSSVMNYSKKDSYPLLNTLLKIAFALHCENQECKYLLKKAGITLSSSSVYNLIIRYCFENKIFDINDVNQLLETKGFEPII